MTSNLKKHIICNCKINLTLENILLTTIKILSSFPWFKIQYKLIKFCYLKGQFQEHFRGQFRGQLLAIFLEIYKQKIENTFCNLATYLLIYIKTKVLKSCTSLVKTKLPKLIIWYYKISVECENKQWSNGLNNKQLLQWWWHI